VIATAPSVKPSLQSRLVLEAMATEAKQGEARWEKMMAMLERLIGKVEAMCHTWFLKVNQMRTMYASGLELTYTAIT
jgi:hypothetical protein